MDIGRFPSSASRSGLSDLDDSIMAEARAAIRRNATREATFRQEKSNIISAMGASPALLLTPSADPALQRMVGAYTNSRRDGLLSLNNVPSFLQEEDCTQLPVQDDIPCAFERVGDELQQYQEDERSQRVSNGNRKRNWIVGGAAACVILGLAIAVVVSLLGRGTAKNSNDNLNYSDLKCIWKPRILCPIGSKHVPACAATAYSKLMASNISQHVSDEHPCDPSRYAAIALAVAQTNYKEVRDPKLFHALATFYFASKGQRWAVNTNWLQGESPCTEALSWYGIDCDADSNVVGIRMEENNVQGSLSTHIGMLSTLQTIDMGQTMLKGSLPSEIGLLSDLRYFSVSRSIMNGQIPSEIGWCQNLVHLDIQAVYLSTPIPTEIGNLKSLDTFRLRSDYLAGPLPPQFGHLWNLTTLDLGYLPEITGTIPTAAQWGTLTNLIEFILSGPSLDPSPFPYYLTQASSLQTIQLSNAALTGTIPTSIGNLSHLRQLAIQGNTLHGSLPTEMGRLTDLDILIIRNEDIVGTVPSELGRLSNITSLDLSVNRLVGSLPSEIGALTTLTTMRVSHNRLSGTLPIEICSLSNLKFFYYDWCYVLPPSCMEGSCISG